MKTVDEMADELCRILNDYGPNAAVFPMPCYQRLAQHVLDLIAQAKSERSPGDSMTDEEVAKELADAFASAYPGALTWHELTGNQKQGNIAEARRARELFRPGSKAPGRTVRPPAPGPGISIAGDGRDGQTMAEFETGRAAPQDEEEPTPLLCGDPCAPVTEEEWDELGAIRPRSDGLRDAIDDLLHIRSNNAPRATVEELLRQFRHGQGSDEDRLRRVLRHLGRSVVVEQAPMPETEEMAEADFAADMAPKACAFGDPEVAARIKQHPRLCEKCGVETGADGSVSISIWKRDRAELAELKARGIDPAKARAAFGLDEMRDLAPAFVAWAREYISLGRLRECIQERMIHGKWEQTWKDDEVPAESYGELAQQLDMRDAAARRARELWQARHPGDESWPDLAENIAWLVEQATAQTPGDRMGDEELANELVGAFLGKRPNTEIPLQGGHIRQARRARELFRPGTKAPEEKGEEPYFVRQLRSDLDNTIAVARKLALHARDLMAAARVRENAAELKELVEEWADVGDPDDPVDTRGEGG